MRYIVCIIVYREKIITEGLAVGIND